MSNRNDYEDLHRLEKSNFDLKMKVYYLEDSLKRFQDSPHSDVITTPTKTVEINNLKLQLEEKNIELEQRNILLVKAKNAIEALKSELNRLQGEIDNKNDLEDRVRRLKQLNDDMEYEYKEQMSQLETQLVSTRHTLISKEKDRSVSEDKLNQLDNTNFHISEKLKITMLEKETILEQYNNAKKTIAILEDDLSQSNSHLDMFRIQLDEDAQEKNNLKSNISEINYQFDSQIRNIKHSHEQEIEKLRQSHVQMLSDMREQHQKDLTVTRQQLESTITELKQMGSMDSHRIKDEFMSRVSDKNEEIRSLKEMIQSDRVRYDLVNEELNKSRFEFSNHKIEFNKQMDRLNVLKKDNELKNEEIKRFELSNSETSKSLKDANNKIKELNDQLIRDQTDKLNLSNRLDNSLVTIKELESHLNISKVELNQLNKENTTIESVTRDNEKYKVMNNKLQSEQLELTHKCSDLHRDMTQLNEQLKQQQDVVASLKLSLRESNNYNDNISTLKDELAHKLQQDKEMISALEASLNEQRIMTTTTKNELDNERNLRLALERDSQQTAEQTHNFKKYSGQACLLSFNAMKKWDELLMSLLDGDNNNNRFRASSQSNHNYHDDYMDYNNNSHSFNNGSNNNNNNLLLMDPVQLFQQMSVCVERVQLKIERAHKIKLLFETQSKQLVESVVGTIAQTQERISLLSMKAGEAHAVTNNVRDIVDRDKKRRDLEFLEMKSFRDVVLSEHANQLRDQEAKYNVVLQQLDLEKQTSEQLKIQSETRKIEIENLQKNCSRLQEELEDLHKTEFALSELSRRTNELLNNNNILSRENQLKAETMMGLKEELKDIQNEKSYLLQNFDSLTNDVAQKEKTIKDYEDKNDKIMREIDKLRSRQIDPEIAKSIMNTQSLLQQSLKTSNSKTNNNINNNNNSTSELSESLNNLVQLSVFTDKLVNRSEELIGRFNAIQNRNKQLFDNHEESSISSCRRELAELLDANYQVSREIDALADKIKMAVRRFEDKSDSVLQSYSEDKTKQPNRYKHTASNSVKYKIDKSEYSNTNNNNNNNNNSAEKFYFPSRKGIINSSSKSLTVNDLNDINYIYEDSNYYSPVNKAGEVGTSKVKSSLKQKEVSPSLSRQNLTISDVNNLFTPNTSSRMTNDRLNKLGVDLKELAMRLDAFDHSKSLLYK